MGNPDVIVVGLGVAGSATLHGLARRGANVLGIDSRRPPHDQASSHGGTRITRQAIGEGDIYVPLALRSQALWREIEAESGERLMDPAGLVVIGRLDRPAIHAGKPDFLRRTIEAAGRFGIAHELVPPADRPERFPRLSISDAETVYFEPGAGMLFPERCVAAQLSLARRRGAGVRFGERILRLEAGPRSVRVVGETDAYEVDQVVVAAGPWAAGLLGDRYRPRLVPYRQTLHWFDPETPGDFAPGRAPVFIWLHGPRPEDWFYGFPEIDGERGVKIAAERFDQPVIDPDAIDRAVTPLEAAEIRQRHIEGRVRGLTAAPVRSAACFYTMAPDSRFVIGRDPARDRVIVLSACSGHGFKHAPAVGEAVASLVIEDVAPAILAPFDPGLP